MLISPTINKTPTFKKVEIINNGRNITSDNENTIYIASTKVVVLCQKQEKEKDEYLDNPVHEEALTVPNETQSNATKKTSSCEELEDPVIRDLYRTWLRAKRELDNKHLWTDVSVESTVPQVTVLENKNSNNLFAISITSECSVLDVASCFWNDRIGFNRQINKYQILESYGGESQPARSVYMLYRKIGPLSPRDVLLQEAVFDLGNNKLVHVAKSLVEHLLLSGISTAS